MVKASICEFPHLAGFRKKKVLKNETLPFLSLDQLNILISYAQIEALTIWYTELSKSQVTQDFIMIMPRNNLDHQIPVFRLSSKLRL